MIIKIPASQLKDMVLARASELEEDNAINSARRKEINDALAGVVQRNIGVVGAGPAVKSKDPEVLEREFHRDAVDLANRRAFEALRRFAELLYPSGEMMELTLDDMITLCLIPGHRHP